MKIVFSFIFILITTITFAQIPTSGIYIYNYCDMEYNKCMGKCKIKIKGNNIWIYAPGGLTGIKEGELYESGTLHKNHSDKWIIITHRSRVDEGPPLWIDFKRKRFWTF
jgi:hypothetical protein